MATIAIRHLGKRFHGVTVLDDLDLDVTPGTITGLFGPNGAGKTTTLRILLGLTRPTTGTATIDGQLYAQLGRPSVVIGAVLDGPQAHPGRRGRDHLRVLATAAGLPHRRVDEVLEHVELGHVAHRRVQGYSLGQRQRLNLAAALLGDPAALVLDEPTTGLDPHGIAWLHGLLRGYADQGRNVLVSSHLLTDTAPILDRAVIIGRGRLIAHGAVADLLTQHRPGATLDELYLRLTSTVDPARSTPP